MEVVLVPRPLSDTERVEKELNNLKESLKKIDSKASSDSVYSGMVNSVEIISEIVQLEGHAKNFHQMGGFEVLPKLLSVDNDSVKESSAELIAHMAQNDKLLQNLLLDSGVGEHIMMILENENNAQVCVKALYALSCICRDNENLVKILQSLKAIPVLMKMIQNQNEKLRTKSAFFISSIVKQKKICEVLFRAGFGKILVRLLSEEESTSHEHMLSILVTLAESFLKKVKELYLSDPSFQLILQKKLSFYEGKEEYIESYEYVSTLLKFCE